VRHARTAARRMIVTSGWLFERGGVYEMLARSDAGLLFFAPNARSRNISADACPYVMAVLGDANNGLDVV
jgi:hypothetical protein